MQEIKTFRRPIRKSKVAIPLFSLITIFVGSIIVILLYTDLQNPKIRNEFIYILLTGIGFILNSIGQLNYIILTETSIIFQNAIFPRVKNEFKYEELHTLSLYYPKGLWWANSFQLVRRGQSTDKPTRRVSLDCVAPEDLEEIIQILREHHVFVQVFNQERWLRRKHGK